MKHLLPSLWFQLFHTSSAINSGLSPFAVVEKQLLTRQPRYGAVPPICEKINRTLSQRIVVPLRIKFIAALVVWKQNSNR